jgi:predicted nucleic acid-binding Zn ribbon protein
MFFRKPKPAICAVCGKAIEPKERRFVVKNRVTKTQQHTHISCRKPDQ